MKDSDIISEAAAAAQIDFPSAKESKVKLN
jgi:hypothetical protein